MKGLKLALRRTYFGSGWSLAAWLSVAWCTLANWPAWWVGAVVAVAWPVCVWGTMKLHEGDRRSREAAHARADFTERPH